MDLRLLGCGNSSWAGRFWFNSFLFRQSLFNDGWLSLIIVLLLGYGDRCCGNYWLGNRFCVFDCFFLGNDGLFFFNDNWLLFLNYRLNRLYLDNGLSNRLDRLWLRGFFLSNRFYLDDWLNNRLGSGLNGLWLSGFFLSNRFDLDNWLNNLFFYNRLNSRLNRLWLSRLFFNNWFSWFFNHFLFFLSGNHFCRIKSNRLGGDNILILIIRNILFLSSRYTFLIPSPCLPNNLTDWESFDAFFGLSFLRCWLFCFYLNLCFCFCFRFSFRFSFSFSFWFNLCFYICCHNCTFFFSYLSLWTFFLFYCAWCWLFLPSTPYKSSFF